MMAAAAKYEQLYPDILTPEREQMVIDALERVQVAFVSAGAKKGEQALAIRVPDQVQAFRSRGVLTELQVLAAEMLQDAYHISGLAGLAAIPMGSDYVDRSPVHDEVMVERLAKSRRYIQAIRKIPLLSWPVVKAVVLEGRQLSEVVRAGRSKRNRFVQRLRAIVQLQVGLDVLAEHFGLQSRKPRSHKWRER
jgi:hypothetical protein